MMAPGTYWTFGTKACEAHTVKIVEVNRTGLYATDDKNYIHMTERLFATKQQALAAASAYLDRKQAEVSKLQAGIDERRAFIKQQARHCA